MTRRRARIPALALDDLEAWLADQPDITRRNWTVSAIDGFCAALVAGPERIATDAWLRVIFGPSLPTTPMGLAAVQAVLDHRQTVHRALYTDAGRRWSPLSMLTDDGTVLAQPWAADFMFAVKRWPDAWRPMFERNDHVGLMLPIIACSEAEEVEKLIAAPPKGVRDHIGRAYHHIPEAVCAIRDYWRQHAAARRTKPRRTLNHQYPCSADSGYVPGAERLGQVAPGRAGPCDPEHCLDEHPVVPPRGPGAPLVADDVRRDPLPLRIAQHEPLHHAHPAPPKNSVASRQSTQGTPESP